MLVSVPPVHVAEHVDGVAIDAQALDVLEEVGKPLQAVFLRRVDRETGRCRRTYADHAVRNSVISDCCSSSYSPSP